MRIGIPDGVFDDVLPGWKQKIADYFDHWKYNSSTKPSHLNDFENIDHTTGFWIHITNPDRTTFRYSGIKPTQN